MLAKSRRLTSKEVREVIKSGASRRASYVSMKYSPTASALRSAAVVSKKVAKGAVERNRLRRALYRALAPVRTTGKAVIFIQKVPPDPLTTAFSEDCAVLFRL